MDNSFILADSLTTIQKLPNKSINLILTDPPYDIRKYSTGNIPLPGRKPLNNDIAKWDGAIPIGKYVKEFRRILAPRGNLFVFTSYNLFGKWHEQLDPLFDTCNFLIWHKINPPPRIYKNSFLHSCEMIVCAWDRGHTWNFASQQEMHNFFESTICMKPERLEHPTQKPLSIMRHIIKIASKPGDMVLDCFAGTATVGVAALLMKRKYYLVENNQEYYQIASDRLTRAKKRLGVT